MRKLQSMIIRNERPLKAFTGLPENGFDRLLVQFTQCLESARQQRYEKHRVPHQSRPGGGRKGSLSPPELKLFFILFYLKNDPTFEVLGGRFDLSPAKAQANVLKLLPILKQAEKCLQVLPHRHFKPASNNKQDTEIIHKIIIDATERPRSRPPHARQQKHDYRGKKRYHTLKNTVIGDVNKGIPVIGPTAPGSRHDDALLKEELDPHQPGLSSVEADVDCGFQGIQDRYPAFHAIPIPHKKPRRSKKNPNPTFTPPHKKEHRAIRRVRVAVEPRIGDRKSCQILTIKFRNQGKNMADQVILLVAGLCNLKNDYVVQ